MIAHRFSGGWARRENRVPPGRQRKQVPRLGLKSSLGMTNARKSRFVRAIGVLRLRTSKRSSCCAQDDKSAKGSAPPLRMTNEVGSSFSERRRANSEARFTES